MAAPVELLLADTSAWHHSAHPNVAAAWSAYLTDGRIATTEPVQLEVLYSARNAGEYDDLLQALRSLHVLPFTSEAIRRALDVQRLLASRQALHHRVAIPDLLIAAVAEISGATVWHYDADYERIADATGQRVEWIAPRGSL